MGKIWKTKLKKALRECRVVGSYLGMWRKSSSSRAYVCVCVVHSFLSFHPHWRIGVSDESNSWIHPPSLIAGRWIESVCWSLEFIPCPCLLCEWVYLCPHVSVSVTVYLCGCGVETVSPTPLYSMSLFECTPVQKEAFIIFNVPNTKSCQQRMNWFRPSRVEATMENPKNRTTNSTMECQFTNLIHWWFGMFFLVCSIVFLFEFACQMRFWMFEQHGFPFDVDDACVGLIPVCILDVGRGWQ